MKRHIYNSLKKQRGVAVIWLGLSLVPIMGFTFWAVEGTRYVQESSRLRDATEAAAIAITIEDREEQAAVLSGKYISSYVRDIKSLSVGTERVYQAADDTQEILEYIQYTVNARTTHDSWFASTFIPSFNEQQDLAGRSLARKYPSFLGDKSIDIVFVSDFSGSMNWYWGNGSLKIADLKKAVEAISDKVLCKPGDSVKNFDNEVEQCDEASGQAEKTKNRIGIVPFNVRTRELNRNNRAFASSQLRYTSTYESIDWNKWRTYKSSEVYDCSENCSVESEKKEAKNIREILGIRKDRNNTYFPEVTSYVDIDGTIKDMMNNKYPSYSTHYRVNNVSLYKGFGNSSHSQFYNIPLTNNIENVDKLKRMSANGNTAAFQGILRGVQVLAEGNPNSHDPDDQQEYLDKIKMLLVLSDGQESPNNGILKDLVKGGMCDSARERIPGLYIGIIGIDFQASQQSGFQDCVLDKDEDIIDVNNLDELIEKIEELIRKGSKTNGVTKLY